MKFKITLRTIKGLNYLGEGYLECKTYKKAVNSFTKAVELAIKNNDPQLKSFQKRLEKAQMFLE